MYAGTLGTCAGPNGRNIKTEYWNTSDLLVIELLLATAFLESDPSE